MNLRTLLTPPLQAVLSNRFWCWLYLWLVTYALGCLVLYTATGRDVFTTAFFVFAVLSWIVIALAWVTRPLE